MPFKYNPFTKGMDYYQTADTTTIEANVAVNTAAIAALGPSFFDATVGASNADYETIGGVDGAITAGMKRLLIVDDVTETGDVAIPTGEFYMHIPYGLTWDMDDYQFTFAGASRFEINGSWGELQYAHTSANEELYQTGFPADCQFIIRNIFIDNNSTQASCGLFDENLGQNDFTFLMENVEYQIPNVATNGIFLQATNGRFSFDDVVLTMGGTNVNQGIDVDACESCFIRNITLMGSCGATAGIEVSNNTNRSVIDGVISEITTNDIRIMLETSQVSLSNVVPGTSVGIHLNLTQTDGIISNVNFGTNGQLTLAGVEYTFVNCENINGFTDSVGHRSIFNNCHFVGAVSLNSDHMKFTDCHFEGGITVTNGAIDNGFANCQFGSNSGGGALTLTNNAGALRTRIVGCSSDAALVLSDGSEEVAANAVY
jgi:hypothetical protein